MRVTTRNVQHECYIQHFADGDTVSVVTKCPHCGIWRPYYVRLSGIESYELKCKDGAKALEIASRYTKSYQDKKCTLIPTRAHTEKYGRIVGDIMIDGELLTQILVKSGDAWHI